MQHILFIHSCEIDDPKRGTPIRIREILEKLCEQRDFEVETYNATGKRIWKKLYDLHTAPQEVFFGNTNMDWWLLVLSKLFYGKKIVIDLHGSMEEEQFAFGVIPGWKKHLLKWAYRRTIRLFDLVSFVNTLLQKHLESSHLNSVVLYPGYDPALFEHIRDLPPTHHNQIRIGYIGNARGYQGTEQVLHIAKRLAENGLPFSLRIISSEKKETRKMILDELGDSQPFLEEFYDVHHADALKRIAECDVLLVLRPKNIVTDLCFPSKLPEYLATGRTVILSDFADVRLLLHDGVDAYLVHADTREDEAYELIKKIIRKQKPLLETETVQRAAYKTFLLDNVTKQFIERLRNL